MFQVFAAFLFTAKAEQAEITQIEELQWKITWNDSKWVNPMNVITDNPKYTAFLTDENDNEIFIYYNKQVIFPLSGNYITINLENMNLPDGRYFLTIPETYVTLIPGSVPNEIQYFYITIGEEMEIAYPPVFTPIKGNTFDISWENVTAIAPQHTAGAYIVNTETEEKYEMLFLQGENYSKANIRIIGEYLKINITCNYPDLPDGNYKFFLPEGYVSFNGTNKVNEAIEGYEFTYEAPWTEGPYTTSGPNAQGLITVTWTDATEVKYNTDYKGDGFGTIGIAIYDGSDSKIEVSYPENISLSGNSMIIDLNKLNLHSGVCQMVVPEGCIFITVDGETGLSNGLIYRFNYTNPNEPENPDQPEDPKYSLYTGEATWSVTEGTEINTYSEPISVNWGGNIITFAKDQKESLSIFGMEAGYRELTFDEEVRISNDYRSLLINIDNQPADTYRINIPEGYVFITKDGVNYINASSSIDNIIVKNAQDDPDSGVYNWLNENKNFRIFNLNGIKIMETDSISELSKLPQGFYIINGKIRKL